MTRKVFVFILILIVCGASQTEHSDFPNSNSDSFAEKPKNIILMIGDGMGVGQVSAGIFNTTKELTFERFSHIGFQKTHAYDDLITDSAAAATAMACGEKTYRNAIGLDKDTVACQSILEEAELRKLATGVVVTSTLVHATPAAFYSHQRLRSFYEDIAEDLAEREVDFLIGGGQSYFHDRRNDKRNLLKELRGKNYDVWFTGKRPLSKIRPRTDRNFLYFTADKQPVSFIEGRKYLPLASEMATKYLKKRSDEGFFLMIEGSQIDWAGHANEGTFMLKELYDFNAAVERILEFAVKDKETLVIVTADHETGGLAINPKSKKKRLKFGFTSNNHTGTLVPVYAMGPKAELFSGIYDNTDLYHKMREALGWNEKIKSTTGNNVK